MAMICFVQGLADFGPVDVAFEQVGPLVALTLEVLEVDADDPLAERANPVLRVPEQDDVADIEVRLEPGTLELIDVAGEFQRA